MRRRQLLAWWALAATSGGCALATRPTLPQMDVLQLPARCSGPAPTLLVMLPGAYSQPPEFVEAGFAAALQRNGVAADMWVVDSHLGYFADKSILRRLREEIVRPARGQGYRQVWLVGISLGGFAALGYAARHGDEIDGVLALAPYLGPRRLLLEIADAGGPAAWRASQPRRGTDEVDREIWDCFSGAPPALPVYLGYGRDDRFADAHRVLAGLLPPQRVQTVAGGHDWPVWSALWQDWLAGQASQRHWAAGCSAAT